MFKISRSPESELQKCHDRSHCVNSGNITQHYEFGDKLPFSTLSIVQRAQMCVTVQGGGQNKTLPNVLNDLHGAMGFLAHQQLHRVNTYPVLGTEQQT